MIPSLIKRYRFIENDDIQQYYKKSYKIYIHPITIHPIYALTIPMSAFKFRH